MRDNNKEVLAEDEQSKLFTEFNKRFAVVNRNGKATVLEDYHIEEDRPRRPEEFIFSTFRDFCDLYRNKIYSLVEDRGDNKPLKITAKRYAEEWLDHRDRREYMDGIVFDPANKHSKSQKNLWQGLAIEPNPTSHPEHWLDHMYNNVCDKDDELLQYLLNYYAHSVQKPWEIPGVALVFRGGKGVGKGTAIKPLQYIFGDHFYQTQDKEKVLGRFNSAIQNKVVIFLNETMWGSFHTMESVLKGLITEPFKTIEGKGANSFQVANHSRIILDSNHDWVVPATADERRYCYINIPDHEHKQDADYFAAIINELENGGAEGLLHLLMNRDIANFKPNVLPGGNAMRGADMVVQSLSPIHEFLLGWLHDGCRCHGEKMSRISRPAFYDMFVEAARSRSIRGIPSKVAFYKTIREALQIEEKTYNGYDVFVIDDVDAIRQRFCSNVLKCDEVWGTSAPSTDEPKEVLVAEVAGAE